ncbi:WD40 domain containing protein [Pyrrhoderma noxium]|uniref:WD40 domain containing protein n=1 Tax=Pyrrhoderma noxium TaxID=2282107 RepID=A0A286UKZ7_9AGAM|nr:WD40 domain containing protein [Pyrrhoderma noxium]
MSTSYLPFTKVFLGDEVSVALTGNGHIQVLANDSGDILHSTISSSEYTEKIIRSGPLAGANVDQSFKYLVTITNDKTVRVWEIHGLKIISEREAAKKPTDVCFTRDAQTVLITDKFGDVHRYPLHEDEKTTSNVSTNTRTAKRMHDESLILGHVSMLTALLLSEDEKYIITADRDEHIRISWYPEAYTIESYCLGHKKFVSSIHFPSWDTSLLVSGGGDTSLKVWKWLDGRFLYDINISDVVMPFIKVTRKKSGYGEGSDHEDENGVHIRRGGPVESVHGENAENDMAVDDEGEKEPQEDQQNEESSEHQEPAILAVQKIVSLDIDSHKLLVFSVHGATALFYCQIRGEMDSSPAVGSIDIGSPVLDFDKSTRSGEMLVAVDNTWREKDSTVSQEAQYMIAVKYIDGQLRLSEDSTLRALVSSLNSTALIKEPDTLEDIDYYAALITLPKNVEAGYNAMEDELISSEVQPEGLSGKELGRLKTKKAMLALQTAGEHGNTVNPGSEPQPKRQKNELDV